MGLVPGTVAEAFDCSVTEKTRSRVILKLAWR